MHECNTVGSSGILVLDNVQRFTDLRGWFVFLAEKIQYHRTCLPIGKSYPQTSVHDKLPISGFTAVSSDLPLCVSTKPAGFHVSIFLSGSLQSNVTPADMQPAHQKREKKKVARKFNRQFTAPAPTTRSRYAYTYAYVHSLHMYTTCSILLRLTCGRQCTELVLAVPLVVIS